MKSPPPAPGFEGLRAPGSGPTDPHPRTRKRMPLWDRVKFVLVLTAVYLILVWNEMASYEGIISVRDATVRAATAAPWIFWLLGAEVLRQIHFSVSERSAGYHRFWTRGVFGGFERWTHRRFSDWNRFRMARAVKWLFWIALLALVLGEVLETSPALALFQAPALLWQALPYVAQLAFAFFFIAFQFVGLFWLLSRGGVETYFPDDIKTRFTDVWGQDHVVERVKENIVFLERPDEIEERGGYVPSGLLLWGPPGTGKTLMAEAVAGETGKPYVFVDPGAFVNMFMGVGILKVKSLFRKLRKLSLRYGGVIVFFDEADSLGRRGSLAQQGPRGGPGLSARAAGCHGFDYLAEESRWLLTRRGAGEGQEPGTGRGRFFMGGNMGGGGGDPGTLQALLTELSGLKKPRGVVNRHVRRLLGMRPKPPPKYRILVMMATNMPNSLDEALLRPGRIDRIYKVGYPSKAGRVRTYRGYFDKVDHELTEEQLDKLATITPYATGATIKDLVNESLITAIRAGRNVITWADVTTAKRLKQLGPPEDVEYIERERHAVAVHEACHAVAAYRTRYHLEIDIATIEKGADYLGMVASIKPEDQFTRWKSEHEADIMVSLASLAGERMFFAEDNSSGVSGDLYSATYLTALMEAHWGMGRGVTSVPALQELEISGGTSMPKPGGGGGAGFTRAPGGRQPLAPDVLGERIEYNLVRLLEAVGDLLREHRREVLCLAHALETHKTLNGDDVIAVLEHRRGTLVDGSSYASDEFYAEIEEYHLEAARAHREHSHVARDLPVPPDGPRSGPVASLVRGAVVTGNGHGSALPTAVGPAPVAGPDFVPWGDGGEGGRAPALPPVPPLPGAVAPPGRRRSRVVPVVAASLAALTVFTLLGVYALDGRTMMADGVTITPGTGTLLAVSGAVVAALVGAGVVSAVIRAGRAARLRAEAQRDRAVERAQFLAAAMDPEVAMRILGYDGTDGPRAR
ncbi:MULTISPECIES: AAA family ATPase [Streptosporangium]|uniref:ATP-dependent Zn protease n=1 Tax=Streptosporangium brasiliense TaxID=47480 RepID=A0ABT9RC80_9ACTN|nr:AAA family ATPase [Streptosporangium brasiliense]MDP9866864.1 ATP-dependent Zn protease [Streptosporangium brasiliense]